MASHVVPIATHTRETQNAAQQQPISSTSKVLKKALDILNTNVKDFYRFLQNSVQWADIFISENGSTSVIANFLSANKGVLDGLSLFDFAKNSLKIFTNTYTYAKGENKDKFTIIKSVCYGIWDSFKIAKWVTRNSIISLSSTVFTNWTIVGGTAFAFANARSIYEQRNLYIATTEAAGKKYHGLKIVNNIAKLAVAIFTIVGAVYGYMVPSAIFLFVGTTILATNIAATILKPEKRTPATA